MTSAQLILQNYSDPTAKLKPYETRVYLWKK
jgi:hypothetical protein